MAAQPVNPDYDLPNLAATYDEAADVLYISVAERAPIGESIANGVAVFYDKDPDEEPASVVAMHIIGAKGQLKPFVDAVLRQHGVEPPQPAVVERDSSD